MTDNPFTEDDITNMALSCDPRHHALARLKDQQCMDSLCADYAKLRETLLCVRKMADRWSRAGYRPAFMDLIVGVIDHKVSRQMVYAAQRNTGSFGGKS